MYDHVCTALQKLGMLFVDGNAPSISSLLHKPEAVEIYEIAKMLEQSGDVVVVPLLKGGGRFSDTFVYRTVWCELFEVGRSKSFWQTNGLTNAAKKLLKQVDAQQELDGGDLEYNGGGELRERLLVYEHRLSPGDLHGPKKYWSWDRFAEKFLSERRSLSYEDAVESLKSVVAFLPHDTGEVFLPWEWVDKCRSKGIKPFRKGG